MKELNNVSSGPNVPSGQCSSNGSTEGKPSNAQSQASVEGTVKGMKGRENENSPIRPIGMKQWRWWTGFVAGLLGGILVNVAAEYLKPRLFSPNVIIEFEPEPPYVIQTPITPVGRDITKEYYPAYVFRIGIRNLSGYQVARKCVVMLTDLWHIEGGRATREPNFEPVRLDWYPHMPVDLNADMRVFAPFAQIAHPAFQAKYENRLYSGDPTTPQFRFRVPNYPRWMRSHISPGNHLFKIAVYFDNRPAVEQEFELQWSGGWSENEKEMLKNAAIRKRD